MRVLVYGLNTVIKGEVISIKLLDGVGEQFDLEAEFAMRCAMRRAFRFTAGWSGSEFWTKRRNA